MMTHPNSESEKDKSNILFTKAQVHSRWKVRLKSNLSAIGKMESHWAYSMHNRNEPRGVVNIKPFAIRSCGD